MLSARRLSSRPNDLVQRFIDFGLDWLESRRYSLTVDVDMARWARAMRESPSTLMVNPTYDPACNSLSPENSFWIDIRAGSHSVAIMAARLFQTDDYEELKRSGRLWYDAPSATDYPLDLAFPPQMPLISGRVGHEGGLWVHPDHRKRGLSVMVPHLLRALCFRAWSIDWQTGSTTRGIGECGIAKWAYGMQHLEPCFDGYFPVTRRPQRLFVVYTSQEELIAGLDEDVVAGLLPDRHQQPVDGALRVKEG
jgi:GNAT superfamily N-acetyltransferase